MIFWPAKDPDEVLDYTWKPPLDAGDTITAFNIVRNSGTVAIDSNGFTTSLATAWLSGGTAGETSIFTLTVITAGGRTFETTASLLIADSAILATFRLRYPAFASVADGTVAYWIADAELAVDAGWPEASIIVGRLAYVAHRLSETGALTTAIPAGLTSFRSGSFSATVDSSIAGLTGFAATSYGREYLALRRAAFVGPRLAWTPPAALY